MSETENTRVVGGAGLIGLSTCLSLQAERKKKSLLTEGK